MSVEPKVPNGFNAPQCLTCKHDRKGDGPPTCDAFPDGIPSDIIFNLHDHRRPFPGDHGIRYEPLRSERRLKVSVGAK